MTRAITSLMLLVALLAGTVAQPVGSSAAPRIKRRTIAPGVKYIRKVFPGVPLRVHIVTVDPSYDSTFDTVLASNRLPGLERTSRMARRSGALVAINGDFARPSGRPVHLFARDGHLVQTQLSYGRNFSMRRDESGSYFGPPKPRIYATELEGSLEHPIAKVNDGNPGPNQIVMYTPESAGLFKTRKEACVARVYPMGPVTLSAEGVPSGRYEVDAVRCSYHPLARKGGTLLVARRHGSRAEEFVFPYLTPGEQLDIGWTLDWPAVTDSIGGNPLLISAGTVPWSELSGPEPFLARNPRTAVGVTAAGKVILVVVDGRWRRGSIGVTLTRLARIFKNMKAVWALNLDGGGSSTLVINGKVVNRPSDSTGERPVSTALVLLPGPDPGETDGRPEPPTEPAAEDPTLLTDPASTGGLADFLVSRDRTRSRALTRYARAFDRATRVPRR